MPPEESNIDGLVAKNTELLSELKTTRAKLREFESLDIDTLKSAASELKSRKQKELEDGKEYEKLLTQQKEDHAKELASRDKALEEARSSVRGVIVDSKLRSALASANVDPLMMDAAVDMLSHKVAVTETNGQHQARLGDKDVKDWVAEWSKSDVGKRFTLADTGAGGGTPGSTIPNGKTPHPKGDWEKFFNPASPEYSMMNQAQLLESDPQLFEALTKKYAQATTEKMKAAGFRGA